MFLNTNDYKPQIRQEIKSVISNDPTVWSQSELTAQEEVTSYLRNRYDVTEVFNKTGSGRNPLIVMYMVDVVLYHIHSRIAPRNIPEVRIVRYEQAVEFLKRVNKGSILPDLPLLKNDKGETEGGGFRMGSNPKLKY